MNIQTVYIRLRQILVHLYPTLADAKRVADDASVVRDRVTTDNSMINFWHELLQEAGKQDKLTTLLSVATSEYLQNQALATTIAACQ
ncbi:MAG: effector-associated domain EAD1-containing protein [Caldilineaceae bacterium]